jgi:histidinol-phosphate aminotransferase
MSTICFALGRTASINTGRFEAMDCLMIPTPKPGVLDIAPYIGGRATAAGATRVFKLSSNEGALGASPAGVEAFQSASGVLDIYPEGSAKILRDAIGEAYGLNPDRIVCGNGSDELLTMLANAYLRPGDEVLFSEHAFLVYRIATLANSAVPVSVPEKNLRVDVDAMLAAVSPRTRLIYLANPNNPTGTYLTGEEVRRLHAGLPPTALLVIDAAYAEYVRRNDFESGIEMVSQFDNVVMTRTFSKIYGLAGLRVGWAFCPAHVADALNRVRGPFNVSTAAQRAAAAALKDRRHIEDSITHNEKWKSWLVEHIRKTGLRVDDGVANFVLIHFAASGVHTAKAADEFLMSRGIILRGVGNYGLPNCLRLTIGTEEANRMVAAALEEFMRTR